MRPAVSNEHVAVYGSPTSIAAAAAAHLLGRRHRLDPGDVGAAGDRPSICSRKAAPRLVGEPAERREQLAGRADRAGDDDRPRRRIGDVAGDRRRRLGQLEHSVLGPVQRQPVAVAAERIGEDDVGAGVDEALVQIGDVSGRSTFHSSGGSPTSGRSRSSSSRSPRRRGALRVANRSRATGARSPTYASVVAVLTHSMDTVGTSRYRRSIS